MHNETKFIQSEISRTIQSPHVKRPTEPMNIDFFQLSTNTLLRTQDGPDGRLSNHVNDLHSHGATRFEHR